MMRRFLMLSLGLALLGGTTGCNRNQEIQAELFRTRDRSKAQMDILKKSNELMNRQLNDMREKVKELRESNDRLSGELTELATRPDEVKLEIITDVNARFSGMAQAQDEFTAQVDAQVKEKTEAIESDLESKLADLTGVLEKHQEFVHFVASEQDSINRVFANRFDSRPWYQSVIGKWKDMELARQETP